MVVVDPAWERRGGPILMEAAGQYFVAPDNGVLVHGLRAREAQDPADLERRVFPPAGEPHVSRPRYFRSGRRAPGRRRGAVAKAGKLIEDYLRPAFEKPQRTGKRTWTGRILKIDRFGNIVTNFHVDDFPDLERATFAHGARSRARSACWRATTPSAVRASCSCIVGSSGYLEISLGQGSAAKRDRLPDGRAGGTADRGPATVSPRFPPFGANAPPGRAPGVARSSQPVGS